ncbi:MAG TPA: T9SS type A sorting domain-containing protein, partial [Bacteroidetes bacterium]|nr:T9SS type A sorting domain-containing protein [Bacteroidota bacterium]
NGYYSYDPDGDSLSFHWRADNGSGIGFLDSTAMNAKTTTPVVKQDTTFRIYLKVDDGVLYSEPDTFYLRVLRPNRPPVADAGPDQTVFENDTVHLDGRKSYDPDGDAITYLWHSPSGIPLSDSTGATPSFKAPASEIAATRILTFILEVNDGRVSSEPDTVLITVKHKNNPPVALFITDTATVNEGDTVRLTGRDSYDPDGDSLSFHWRADAGSGIRFFDSTAMDVRVGVPAVKQDTTFRIYLKVDDGVLYSQPDTFYLRVKNVNRAPVALIVSTDELSYGVTLYEHDTVWIDGSPSYDPDGDPIIYSWDLPKGFGVFHADSAKVMVIAPGVNKNTAFVASLFVSDGILRSEGKFTINVLKKNRAPIADAGVPFSVLSGKTDELDGSGSTDPDGDSLRFTWIAPAGIQLSDLHAVGPVFQAPQVTSKQTLVFKLVVSDGTLSSDTSRVEVTVLPIEATLRVSAKVNDTVIPYGMRHITLYYQSGEGQWKMADVLSYDAGGVTFYAVWEGEWMITVDPVGRNAGFVTTFYGDVPRWTEAKSFHVTGGGETQVEVNTIPVAEKLDGSGVIDGEIFRDTVTAGVARNTITRLEGSRAGKVPAEGVAVFLHRSADDALLASTRTDDKGVFRFEKLPLGAYYLLVELPGFDANTPWAVEVTESDTVVSDVNFVINEADGNITGIAQTEDIPVRLYPNPAKDYLFVRVDEQDRKALLRIYDLTGHLLMTTPLPNRTNRIDLGRLQKGFYLLRIDSRGKTVTRRIIKR